MRIAPGRQSERSCSCKQQAGYVLNFGCKGTAWSGHFLAQAHKNTAKLSKKQFRGKNYAFGFSTNSTIVTLSSTSSLCPSIFQRSIYVIAITNYQPATNIAL